MTAVGRRRRTFIPKPTLSKSGLDDIEFVTPAEQLNAAERYRLEREAHQASRECPALNCDHVGLPCPDHGTPAEDTGGWLRFGQTA